jgi:hypothetical protein
MSMNKPGKKKPRSGTGRGETVLLEDLVPRDDVTGGAAGKLRFGQELPARPVVGNHRVDPGKRRVRGED